MRKQAYPYEDENTHKAPEDLMEKYIWLMSDDSRSISGQSIDCQ